MQIQELLDVHDDDTQFSVQSFDKCVSVGRLNKHRLVNVHVHHHGVQLVAQLQTVHNNHHLVVGVFTLIAEILQLQSRPSDDITLSKPCGILQQK